VEFRIRTNWCAVTGAPSSGKTSVIEELARRGYPTEPEVARQLLEDCLRQGEKIEDIRKKNEWLQNEILRLKFTREENQDPGQLVFLDRGIPDSLTYFRIAGLNTGAPERASLEFHYRWVFIFDRLSLVFDGVRTESDAIANQIDLALEKDYLDLGYRPVRVPVLPIPARADFILGIVENDMRKDRQI
jgi:predicted ATPase